MNSETCFYNLDQEFTQTKAIDWQALIGNIGGYVGMVLGWCFMGIPPVLKKTFEWLEKVLIEKKAKPKPSGT